MTRLGWFMAMVLLTAYAAVLAERTAGQDEASSRRRALEEKYLEAFSAPSPTSRPADDLQTRELRSLIRQINAMSLPTSRRNYAAEPAEVITPTPIDHPAPKEAPPGSASGTREPDSSVQSPRVVQSIRSAKIVTPAPSATTLSPKALDRLRTSTDPESIDPLRLAEALFRGGHGTEAADFYRKALETGGDDIDRAWLLYRLGQCQAQPSPAEAMQQYRQLLADHPESLWSKLAEVQLLILQEQQDQHADDLLAVVREELEQSQKKNRNTVRPKVLPTVKPQKQSPPAGGNATSSQSDRTSPSEPEPTRVIP